MTAASCSGRICVAGEDLDWTIGPSVLAAISMRTEVQVSRTADNRTLYIRTGRPYNRDVTLDAELLNGYHEEAFSHLCAAASSFRKAAHQPVGGLAIDVQSSIPPASGLSSSAAVTVAAVAALNAFFGEPLPKSSVLELAYAAETVELRTGAGQMDFYGCAYGGVHYLDSVNQPPSPLERLTMPSAVSVLVIDTRVVRSTKDIIATKRLRWSAGEPGMVSYVHETADRVAQIRKLLGHPDPDPGALGTLINECQDLLRSQLRVSTDLIDECVNRCLTNGAYGAKLTGTGLGGCLFALAPPDAEDRLATALSTLPVTVHRSRIEEVGLIVS